MQIQGLEKSLNMICWFSKILIDWKSIEICAMLL